MIWSRTFQVSTTGPWKLFSSLRVPSVCENPVTMIASACRAMKVRTASSSFCGDQALTASSICNPLPSSTPVRPWAKSANSELARIGTTTPIMSERCDSSDRAVRLGI